MDEWDAGTVIRHGGVVYRFAQDCVQFYGKELVVMKVIELTRTLYTEVEVEQIVHPGSPGAVAKPWWPDVNVGANTLWNGERLHHINMHWRGSDDGYIAAMDGDDRIDKSFHIAREGWFSNAKFVVLSIALAYVAVEFCKRTYWFGWLTGYVRDDRSRDKFVRVLIATVALALAIVLAVTCQFFQRCFRPTMYF